MKAIENQFQRVLSIYPTSKGFGFVVMERGKELIDWGTKRSRVKKSQKNKDCVKRATSLMKEYQPDAVILPEADDPRRCLRIRNLTRQIAKKARTKNIQVVTVTRGEVQKRFAPYGATTKYARAKLIAEWYPPLKPMLPRPRKAWESEDGRLGAFGATAQTKF